MWIFYSLLTVVTETSKDVLVKSQGKTADEYVSAFSLQFFAMLLLGTVLLLTGIPSVTPVFWAGLLVSAVFIPLWSVLYMKAIKWSPLSTVMPILALNPIFTALLSILFDHRLPSMAGWFGIAAICTGLYCIRLSGQLTGRTLLTPIASLRNERGALAMAAVAFIWSVGTHINKVLISASSPLMFAFGITGVGSLVLYFWGRRKTDMSVGRIAANLRYLLPLGVLNGLSELWLGLALRVGYTPYVVSVKRFSIVTTSVSGRLLFREHWGPFQSAGLVLVMSGIALVIIGK